MSALDSIPNYRATASGDGTRFYFRQGETELSAMVEEHPAAYRIGDSLDGRSLTIAELTKADTGMPVKRTREIRDSIVAMFQSEIEKVDSQPDEDRA